MEAAQGSVSMSDWPQGNGEMAARIRAFEWSRTPLGSVDEWPSNLRALVELMLGSGNAIVVAWGADLRAIYNDSYARLLGHRHPHALGASIQDIFSEAGPFSSQHLKALRRGETVELTDEPYPFDRGRGVEEAWFDITYTPVLDARAKVAGCFGLMVETTSRVTAEARLRESEARFQRLAEGIAQATWEAGAAGVVVADSPSWRRYTGQTLEQWLGHGWIDAVHPEDRAHAERRWREDVAAGGQVDAEFRLHHAARAGYCWTNLRAVPIHGDDGSIRKWLSMNIDIDERKQAEARLREREADLARVQRIGGVGGVDIDILRGMRSWRSPEYLRLHGLPSGMAEETHGQWRERVHPEDRERAEQALFDALESNAATYDCEYRIIRPSDGAIRWIHSRADIERDPDGRPARLVGAHLDVTEQKRMQEALRESEELKAFLLKLSDGLRPLMNPADVRRTAVELLRAQLGCDRVCYGETREEDESTVFALAEAAVPGLAPMPGRAFPLADFAEDMSATLRKGQPIVHDDVQASPALRPEHKEAFAALQIRSCSCAPLVVNGRFVAALIACHATPHAWTPSELDALRETAERLWAATEKAQAEEALRKSEARFRQFADASSGALWIRNADSLRMEYASRAIAAIYGVEPEAVLGDVKRWAALIMPKDRNSALEHIDRARLGEASVHEFRIGRIADQEVRWVRNTIFPLLDEHDRVQRIGGIFEDVTDAVLATEHQAVLVAELQHRVRNILAIIRSIAARTGARAESVKDYGSLMQGRLLALSRVQALLTRTVNAGVAIEAIVQEEVSSQAHSERQYDLAGPNVALSPKAAEVMTLAVHELATNAVKYGALSMMGGHVTVRWATFEKEGQPWLVFDWIEEHAPESDPLDVSEPRRRGFGSELIEDRLPYELGGWGRLTIRPRGVRCHLEFPLKEGASILETDAPRPGEHVPKLHKTT